MFKTAKRFYIVCCVLVFMIGAIWPYRVGFAGDAYDFLNLDKSAKIASLGGNGVARAGDLNAFFDNPAVLCPETHQRIVFGFQKHLMDINSGMVVYGRHVQDMGDFAMGIHYIHYGDFDQTNDLGQKTGTFSAKDMALQLGYAFDVDSYDYGYLRAGVALKFIYSGIQDYSSTAYALDLGIMMHFYNEHLKIGVSLLNWGGQLSAYDNESESLPLDLRLALTNKLEGLPVDFTLGLVHLNDDNGGLLKKFQNFTVGAAYHFSHTIEARVGLNNFLRRNVKGENSAGLSGISFGMGINYMSFKFDYALTSWGSVGMLHQLALSTTL